MMKRILTGLVALLLLYGTAYGTTLNLFGKTDGLSLSATREQNTNIAALQTLVTKNDSTTATAAELNYLDITTLGTGAASKAVVLDTGDDYTWPATGVLTYGVLKDPAGTTLGATAAEINQVADVSARIVPLGATGNIPTTAEGRIIRIGQDGSANTAITLTLPEATGSGAVYRVLVNTTNTGGLVIAALTTDTMVGIVNILDLDAAAQGAYQASGTDDKITLNSTTTGGQIGDWLEFVDYADTIWQVKGSLAVPTGSNPADPFSAT